MKVTLNETTCVVEREPGDPKFYGVVESKGESRLLHHVKNILNAQGHDLVKKRMWKDGHLVDELQQYLRTRSPKSQGAHVYIYNHRWAVEGAEAAFNEDGRVVLAVIRNIWKEDTE